MLRRWLELVAMLAVILVVFVGRPRLAKADSSTAHSVSVAVLAFDSDDAEEQADALTGALRSRIRASQGWSLVETSQSLGMLTAALRCPGKPIPAECEQRIADQIKSERYIFGYLVKGPQSGSVTAEIHLYQKSKPDTIIRESYADNLKDQNDDTLRKIAQRVLDRLGGNAVGTIVVRMGSENGEVVVDGDKRIPLQNGTARLELAPGSHSVEVAVTGQSSQKRNVLVTAGKETVVDVATSAPVEPAKPEKPFPTRKVLGGSILGLGVASWIVATVTGLNHLSEKSAGENFNKDPNNTNPQNPTLPKGTSLDTFCQTFSNGTICSDDKAAKRDSTIFWFTASAGLVLIGVGGYLLFTDGGSDTSEKTGSAKKSTPKRKTVLVPAVGMGNAGLVLTGSF